MLYVVARTVQPDVGRDIPGFLRGLQDLGDLTLAGVPRHLQGRLALPRHLVQSQAGGADQSDHGVRHPLGDGGQQGSPAVQVGTVDVDGLQAEQSVGHEGLAVQDGGQERGDPTVVRQVGVDSLARYQILNKLLVALVGRDDEGRLTGEVLLVDVDVVGGEEEGEDLDVPRVGGQHQGGLAVEPSGTVDINTFIEEVDHLAHVTALHCPGQGTFHLRQTFYSQEENQSFTAEEGVQSSPVQSSPVRTEVMMVEVMVVKVVSGGYWLVEGRVVWVWSVGVVQPTVVPHSHSPHSPPVRRKK